MELGFTSGFERDNVTGERGQHRTLKGQSVRQHRTKTVWELGTLPYELLSHPPCGSELQLVFELKGEKLNNT